VAPTSHSIRFNSRKWLTRARPVSRGAYILPVLSVNSISQHNVVLPASVIVRLARCPRGERRRLLGVVAVEISLTIFVGDPEPLLLFFFFFFGFFQRLKKFLRSGRPPPPWIYYESPPKVVSLNLVCVGSRSCLQVFGSVHQTTGCGV
jgi:hypothetical protein